MHVLQEYTCLNGIENESNVVSISCTCHVGEDGSRRFLVATTEMFLEELNCVIVVAPT